MAADEEHFCWEQCCDMGPHGCVCGNDCEPAPISPVSMVTTETTKHGDSDE